ncbi:lysylphosphatidylglycerol synthase transmembrane domain-containing protein [Microbacterium sp. PRC9]|uniref:lysylphosphatidylglycerol synthase transmembrane domain-containing protein n=1 Tax=Microbacterium sp. PRC9 TaxID=2962591 RepID=UPI002881887D|nr:lysylphosphatidylglycerol synthase transmembrane domain-containing protein [Microbacterium sp. PRC9]MDT0141092.1 lysylphosphatidylglycerol synthase transmembrane domain-containing protein [Microbacterium sp. PRC9]
MTEGADLPMATGVASPRDPASPPENKPRRRGLSVVLIIVRYLLITAVVAFAVWYFVRIWGDMQVAIQEMQPWRLAASFFVLLIGMALNVLSWTTILRGLGHPVPVVRGAQIMLVGQLGKYVPGSVWAYLAQMELGRQHGVARARVLVTSLYAVGIGVVCSLLLGAVALPHIASGHPELLWLFALLPIGLVCLHPAVMTWLANLALRIFRRPPLEHRVQLKTIAVAVAWCLASYLAYGAHLWLLSGEGVEISNVGLMSAAIGLGFTAGLLAFVLPSGVGVREAVLIGLMGAAMTTAEASAVALVSRGMFTAGDLLMAGTAALAATFMHRRLHREDVRTAEYADVAAERP